MHVSTHMHKCTHTHAVPYTNVHRYRWFYFYFLLIFRSTFLFNFYLVKGMHQISSNSLFIICIVLSFFLIGEWYLVLAIESLKSKSFSLSRLQMLFDHHLVFHTWCENIWSSFPGKKLVPSVWKSVRVSPYICYSKI